MSTIYPSVVKIFSAPDLINFHPIIIISSKPLSKRSHDILTDAGKLKEFNYEKYASWSILHFISFGNPDFVFFDITDADVLDTSKIILLIYRKRN